MSSGPRDTDHLVIVAYAFQYRSLTRLKPVRLRQPKLATESETGEASEGRRRQESTTFLCQRTPLNLFRERR